MNGEWNLIVRVCNACNHAKSDLEDDISAIPSHLNRMHGAGIRLITESETQKHDARQKRVKVGVQIRLSDRARNISTFGCHPGPASN